MIGDKIVNLLRRSRFENRTFWNRRYITDPTKGSGPGSREDHLIMKRDIIALIVKEYDISSILDVGCGDIAIVQTLRLPGYVGIDISDVVVEQNRTRRPDWNFICADLGGTFQPPASELVICLDVLIHQKSGRTYQTILNKVLTASTRVALISGYSRPDPGWNVFYHEPLSESVRRLDPGAQISVLGAYRGTDLIKVEKAGAGTDPTLLTRTP